MRKLKTAPETNLPPLSKARLKELIEEAVVDAYTEEEQIVGFLTMIEVAICRRGNTRQKVPILDLPMPVPAPAGAEWIAAYRRWRRGSW
jgi:hypothetical protein